MDSVMIFVVQVILGFVTLVLLARWYLAPRLAGLPLETALQPLLAFHTFRYIGLVFLAPTVVGPSLSQTFAVPAALGTTLAGVLALVAIAALRTRSRLAIPLTWMFSAVGLEDLANSFYQALGGNVVNNLGAAYYIPILVVPAAVVSHVMVLGLLFDRSGWWMHGRTN